jgi:hypothetical protein
MRRFRQLRSVLELFRRFRHGRRRGSRRRGICREPRRIGRRGGHPVRSRQRWNTAHERLGGAGGHAIHRRGNRRAAQHRRRRGRRVRGRRWVKRHCWVGRPAHGHRGLPDEPSQLSAETPVPRNKLRLRARMPVSRCGVHLRLLLAVFLWPPREPVSRPGAMRCRPVPSFATRLHRMHRSRALPRPGAIALPVRRSLRTVRRGHRLRWYDPVLQLHPVQPGSEHVRRVRPGHRLRRGKRDVRAVPRRLPIGMTRSRL